MRYLFLLFLHFCSFLFSSSFYQLMALAPHIPIERCRLVNYNFENEVMDQSFDFDEVSFIYPIVL